MAEELEGAPAGWSTLDTSRVVESKSDWIDAAKQRCGQHQLTVRNCGFRTLVSQPKGDVVGYAPSVAAFIERRWHEYCSQMLQMLRQQQCGSCQLYSNDTTSKKPGDEVYSVRTIVILKKKIFVVLFSWILLSLEAKCPTHDPGSTFFEYDRTESARGRVLDCQTGR